MLLCVCFIFMFLRACFASSCARKAYTLGSAFYGLYFIVSYPLFFDLDEPLEGNTEAAAVGGSSRADADDSQDMATPSKRATRSGGGGGRCSAGAEGSSTGGAGTIVSCGHANVFSLRRTLLEALGAGMAVLMLLDVVRVFVVGTDLAVSLQRPCKLDAGLTCAPFTGGAC